MICHSCGSEVEGTVAFCQHCGAPVKPGGVAVMTTGPPMRFLFEATALGFFGRNLLLSLSLIFVFPIPWTLSWFVKWTASEIRASDGNTFEFWGTAANVWKLVALYVLLVGGAIASSLLRAEEDPSAWWYLLDLLIQIVSIAFGWAFMKWLIDNLELDGRRWRFDGSIWGFLGWYVLIYVSMLTIIGWAWAMVGLYSWIATHVQDAGGQVRFLGAGHQMLWRTLVLIPFCLPILTIPWAIKWYYDWLVEQVELTPTEQA